MFHVTNTELALELILNPLLINLLHISIYQGLKSLMSFVALATNAPLRLLLLSIDQ